MFDKETAQLDALNKSYSNKTSTFKSYIKTYWLSWLAVVDLLFASKAVVPALDKVLPWIYLALLFVGLNAIWFYESNRMWIYFRVNYRELYDSLGGDWPSTFVQIKWLKFINSKEDFADSNVRFLKLYARRVMVFNLVVFFSLPLLLPGLG